MAEKNDKMLVHTTFSTWFGWLLEHKMNKDIHDKFKKEIADAEEALFQFKQKQLHISRSMLTRGAAQGDGAIQQLCLTNWYNYVVKEGHNKDMEKRLEEAQAKLKNAKDSAKKASQATMARMCSGNNATLLDFCYQGWKNAMAELKADKQIDALAKKAEQQYKDFMAKKSAEARGVLDRMSSGSDSGLLHVMLSNWGDFVKESKKEKEMEAIVQGHNDRFKSLNLKQKGAAKSVASRANDLEQECILSTFFHSWATETKVENVIKHYGNKLDAKKHQLDAVQTMFRSFANQLEQGIGNTPRTQRKSAGRSKGGSEASGAPQLPPAAQGAA
jgi:cell division septum initiation protein DivIVA